MAKLSEFGIPADGTGILTPWPILIERKELHELRSHMIYNGREADAIAIRDILYRALSEIRPYLTEDDEKKLSFVK